MLGRENVAQHIAAKLGSAEKVIGVSPTTLDITAQVPVQGYAALTQNNLVFVQEGGLSGIQVSAYPREKLTYQGTAFGISGKSHQFDFGGTQLKFGGLESAMEQAIVSNFQLAAPPAVGAGAPIMTPPEPVPTAPPSYAPSPQPVFTPPSQQSPYPSYPQSSKRGPFAAVFIMMGVIFALGVAGFVLMSNTKTESVSSQAVSETDDDVESESENESPNIAPSTPGQSDMMLVFSGSGSELINIRKKESGKYKVWVQGTTYKGKVSEDKIKINDEAGNTLIKVKVKDYGFKVSDGSDTTIIKAKVDGAGYKIKDETTTLARVKPDGTGFKVTDDGGSFLGAITPEGDNWEVRDASGSLLFAVRGSNPKAAAVLLALQNNPLAQAGVLIYLNEF